MNGSATRRATEADIGEIVRLHRAGFRGFFMTRMGPRFLALYYREALACPHSIVLVAERDGQVAGFVAGFLDPQVFYARLRGRKVAIGRAIAIPLLTQPALVLRLMANLLRTRKRATRPATGAELASIAVDPAMGRHGVGRLLVRDFVDAALSAGAPSISLTTDADDNDAVNRFYRSLGFVEAGLVHDQPGRTLREYVLRAGPPASLPENPAG